jgi:hypothetical protein
MIKEPENFTPPDYKAKEIFDKFYLVCGKMDESRKCAIILAEEIISLTPMYTGNLNRQWQYWTDVRHELNKSMP